jgi:hypothetical protein
MDGLDPRLRGDDGKLPDETVLTLVSDSVASVASVASVVKIILFFSWRLCARLVLDNG